MTGEIVMKKITIANLNIELSAADKQFLQARFKNYENLNFNKRDMILKTTIMDNILVPQGKIIDRVNLCTIMDLGENKRCRYIEDRENGQIVSAICYNKDYSEVEIKLLKDRKHQVFGLTDFEYIYTGAAFADRLTEIGGVVLHGSSIAYQGKGVIFSANSGVGKSTHTGLWKERFKDEVTIINDDKPAIRFYDNVPYMFGTPWSGKTDLNTNMCVPLNAIVFIQRSESNGIERLNVRESIFNLTAQIFRPYYDTKIGEKTLDMIDKIIKTVPIYRLNCSISQEAVTTVLNELYGGE